MAPSIVDRASFAGRVQVVASYKGTVVGKLTYKENGDAIDCSKMGVAGKSIPPHIDGITDMEGDAEFILLVEKDAAFMRLAEDRFYEKYPCAIITVSPTTCRRRRKLGCVAQTDGAVCSRRKASRTSARGSSSRRSRRSSISRCWR